MQLRPFSDIFCIPIWVVIILIYPPELSEKKNNKHLVAKQGETCREMSINFAVDVSPWYSAGFFNMPWSLNDIGPTALLPVWRKSFYGFLSPLKICRSLQALNPRTLGPVVSTITARPPRTTCTIELFENRAWRFNPAFTGVWRCDPELVVFTPILTVDFH
jgi:hypothetical protein